MKKTILKLVNITKIYPGVEALKGVNLDFKKGEVHSIVGENGAGKSTLIKIITGAEKQTKGEIYYKEEELINNSPILSINMGINAVYQELNLIPSLTVAENIFYGYEKTQGIVLDKKTMHNKSKELLEKLGVNFSPSALVKDIGIGNQQIVEIAKSLIKNVEVLILDEPTASLTQMEINHLFKIINDLKKQGVSIIYISHRLEEVFRISDRISVLRDGVYISTKDVNEIKEEELITLMVGREIKRHSLLNKNYDGMEYEKVLQTNNLSTKYIKDISFYLKRGEILGIAGLVSSGRTELARALFGIDKIEGGEIIIKGKKEDINSPRDAIHKGIAFITEDRKSQGLILNMPINENTSYAALNKWCKAGVLDKKREEKSIISVLSDLRVKYSSLKERVNNLSGGNQQKIVIGKWLLTDTDIFIFDEPTRGIDVGAKEEVYKIMKRLVSENKSIIMISSEMPEVLSMSDRILVMSKGQVVSEYRRGEVTPEQIFLDSSSLLKERNYE